MRKNVLDLGAIEASLRAVQRNFAQINQLLKTPRDRLDDEVLTNMMAGYAYVDALAADGIDLFALGNSRHLLELNALVLCGVVPDRRQGAKAHLEATETRFYDETEGGMRSLAAWYALHRKDSAWIRAAGVYVRILSEPQLFIEGNHRTGALILSCVLARDGYPPFVLTVDNAKAYFDPSTLITKTRKNPFNLLFQIPKLKKRFAAFLKAHADKRYLVDLCSTRAAESA